MIGLLYCYLIATLLFALGKIYVDRISAWATMCELLASIEEAKSLRSECNHLYKLLIEQNRPK